MHYVILIPGIMGSRLALGTDEVWPPTIPETIFGYGRLAELRDCNLVVTDVIRDVGGCKVFYQYLIDRLATWGFPEAPATGPLGQLLLWPYDWRLDNKRTGALLSKHLTKLLTQDPNGEISLLAHSMGGLIARYALEVADPALGDINWRSRVGLLVTMGTPHRGAPLALVRALGNDGAMGISKADFKAFMSDARYPSGYQLMPPTSANACWSTFASNPALATVDIYDPAIAGPLGLDATNLGEASAFHSALKSGQRPATCRYFHFMGREETTIARTELENANRMKAVSDDDAGDSTVPIWSGTLAGEQFQFDGDEHSTTFKNGKLLNTLSQLLGVSTRVAVAAVAAQPQLRCRLPGPVLDPGSPAIVKVELTAPLFGEMAIRIYAANDRGAPEGPALASARVPIEGEVDQMPPVVIRMPTKPGTYCVTADIVEPRGTDRPVKSAPEPFVVRRLP